MRLRHPAAGEKRRAAADDRSVPGHWEGDLVVGSGGRACLVTLVERSSRFLLASRLEEHSAETVAARLAEMVSSLPAALRRTLGWRTPAEELARTLAEDGAMTV